jgi:hypothetical protein
MPNIEQGMLNDEVNNTSAIDIRYSVFCGSSLSCFPAGDRPAEFGDRLV